MLIPLQPRGRSVTVGSILFLLVVAFLVFHSRNADDVVNYVLKRPASECVQQQHIDPPSLPLSSPETNDGKWEFVPARDAEDYGLSREQCRIAFPKLFVEIEKSVAARKDKPITAKELNSKKVGEGMVRVIVHQGEVCASLKTPWGLVLYVIDLTNMSFFPALCCGLQLQPSNIFTRSGHPQCDLPRIEIYAEPT